MGSGESGTDVSQLTENPERVRKRGIAVYVDEETGDLEKVTNVDMQIGKMAPDAGDVEKELRKKMERQDAGPSEQVIVSAMMAAGFRDEDMSYEHIEGGASAGWDPYGDGQLKLLAWISLPWNPVEHVPDDLDDYPEDMIA